MQMLIYKTALLVERAPSWLAPNSSLGLQRQSDASVAAFALRPSPWMALFGLSRPVRIGMLNEEAGDLVRPALDAGVSLRVRIVELQPSHLATDRCARISVSVWGPAGKMTPGRVFSSVGST